MNREELFKKGLEGWSKPVICTCGEHYKDDLKGGFVSNGVTYIWCCSKECADKTRSKLY